MEVWLFSAYLSTRHHEQQSLPRHPLQGSAGSPAWEPVKVPEVFGDGAASDRSSIKEKIEQEQGSKRVAPNDEIRSR